MHEEQDEIVAEVRQIREQIGDACDFDLRKNLEIIRRRKASRKNPSVSPAIVIDTTKMPYPPANHNR
jgi:hypothetical protein